MKDITIGRRPDVHQIIMKSHWLGRLIAPDVRDAEFRLGRVRDKLIASADRQELRQALDLRYRRWLVDFKRLPVDQGQTPRCVGFSIATALVVGPDTQRPTIHTTADAMQKANEIYMRALGLDEWDGEDPNNGTSVRAGMKAAQAMGYLGSYAWGANVADAAEFVLYYGPAVAGTVWPDSMMETDADGYLNIAPDSTFDGANAQGHAYCLAQVNYDAKNPDGTKGRFMIPQTWGKGWGWQGTGMAFMTFNTFRDLLASQGEVCFPVEVSLK